MEQTRLVMPRECPKCHGTNLGVWSRLEKHEPLVPVSVMENGRFVVYLEQAEHEHAEVYCLDCKHHWPIDHIEFKAVDNRASPEPERGGRRRGRS